MSSESLSKALYIGGVGLSAFTSGALASLSLVTIPVLLTLPTNSSLLSAWRATLDTGVRVCPPFAVAASLSHLLNAYLHYHLHNTTTTSIATSAISSTGNNLKSAKWYFISALFPIAIVPFTFAFLSRTNSRLFEREEKARGKGEAVEGESRGLVRRWARINLVRAGLPAIGAVVALVVGW